MWPISSNIVNNDKHHQYEAVSVHDIEEKSAEQDLEEIHSESCGFDKILSSISRIQDLSLTISNEIELQNRELEDLDEINDESQYQSQVLHRSSKQAMQNADWELKCWFYIAVIIVTFIIIVGSIKIWQHSSKIG
jgi:hypothetical protein